MSTAGLRRCYPILNSNLGVVFLYENSSAHTSMKTFTRYPTGHLADHFTRSQLDLCRGIHLRCEDVAETTIGDREAARLASGGKGRDILKCSCKKRYLFRCACAKNDLICTSNCHSSANCSNK